MLPLPQRGHLQAMPRSALSVRVGGVSFIRSLRKAKGRPAGRPFLAHYPQSVRGVAGDFGAAAPHIDTDEQEQPDHVDEVPVPGGELEAEVLFWREVARI